MNEEECFQKIMSGKAFRLPRFVAGKFVMWPHEYKVESLPDGGWKVSLEPLAYDFGAKLEEGMQ